MRIGMIGTGAISHKHAQAYSNIGYQIATACDVAPGRAKQFCDQYGGEPVATWEDVCRHPRVDFVDVCTFPDFHTRFFPPDFPVGTGGCLPRTEPLQKFFARMDTTHSRLASMV